MPPKVAAFQSGECESFNFTPDSQHFPFCSGRVPFNFHFAINFNLKGYEGGRGAWKVEGGRWKVEEWGISLPHNKAAKPCLGFG